MDPFAGGGAIPLEALRIGADAFSADLNPVAYLLNKVMLEYVPTYRHRLSAEVKKWGAWIGNRANNRLSQFYVRADPGETPIAYIWARTILSEAPDDGSGLPEVPLLRSMWLSRRSSGGEALRWARDSVGNVRCEKAQLRFADGTLRIVRRPVLEIFSPRRLAEVDPGTIARGVATCPVTGYSTPIKSVRKQLGPRRGGTSDARLCAVVTARPPEQGRSFRLPTPGDIAAVQAATAYLKEKERKRDQSMSLVPDEEVNSLPHSINRLTIYGMNTWGDVFTPRQGLALSTFAELIDDADRHFGSALEYDFKIATRVCLSLVLGRVADRCSSLCRYDPSPTMSGINNTFARQALPMVWDFGEGVPTTNRSGGWPKALEWLLAVFDHEVEATRHTGTATLSSATRQILPDDFADAFVTDPPYYDNVSYADLSDFFYVWLKRSLPQNSILGFDSHLSPKSEEIIVEPTPVENVGIKDVTFYLREMTRAMEAGRRVVRPGGIGVVVFAHKSTAGWEAQLQSMLDAGWIISGSWPIDTEMTTKVSAIGQARLGSSIYLVCRPREAPDGALIADKVGDWRDVLDELPRRIL